MSATLPNESQSELLGQHREGAVSVTRRVQTYPAWRTIRFSTCCLVLPIFILTVALGAFICKHQLRSGPAGQPLFFEKTILPHDRAIYVDVDSTHLTFIASRISSVANIVIGFAVTLATFPVARRLLTSSLQEQGRHLTPFQFNLTVQLANGSVWGGLWSLLMYHVSWKRRKSYRNTPLNYLSIATIMAVLVSASVFGADTWLHLATTTVGVTQVRVLPSDEVQYSFGINPSCLKVNNSMIALKNSNITCVIDPSFKAVTINDTISTMQTISGQSPISAVLPISGESISYLGPAVVKPTYDFMATSQAVQSSCRPISQACNLVNNGNITYDCNNGTFNVTGTIFAAKGLAVGIFSTAELSNLENLQQPYGVQNPFYVAAAISNTIPLHAPLSRDPEVVVVGTSVTAIFLCEVTVLDIQYTSADGEILTYKTTPSNVSVTNMFVTGWKSPSDFGRQNIRVDMSTGVLLANTAQEYANSFGASLRKLILSSGAGSIHSVPVDIAQERSEKLVARIPFGPLGAMLVFNMVFFITGLFYAIIAICTSPAGKEAQQHLTIAGVTAHLLDYKSARRQARTQDELFSERNHPEESSRVRLNRTSQGGLELLAHPLQSMLSLNRSVDGEFTDAENQGRPRSWLPRPNFMESTLFDESTVPY